MKRVVGISLMVVGTLIVVIMIGSIGMFYAMGGSVVTMKTGSMKPTINRGESLLVYKIDSAKIQVGNVIIYKNPHNVVAPITSRVQSKTAGVTFTTRSDASTTGSTLVPQSQIIGKVVAIAPGFGKVLDYVGRPYILAALIYTPVVMIAIMEVRRLQYIWHMPTYVLHRRH